MGYVLNIFRCIGIIVYSFYFDILYTVRLYVVALHLLLITPRFTPGNDNPSAPPAKKQLTAVHARNTDGGRKSRISRFTKDEMETALKRVQSTLQEARYNRDLCQRCGLAGHKWMFCLKEFSLCLTKKSGKKPKKKACETSTAVATVSTAKKKAPVHMVGPSVTSLPMQDRIMANLRVKAGDMQQLRVSSSTLAGKVFVVDSEEEKLD